MSPARDVSGQARGLTVMTPIAAGRESTLARYLQGLPGGRRSPLAGVAGTHFARWVVIDDVVPEVGGEGVADHLARPRLLFSSDFDGELGSYLERLRIGLGSSADAIWSHCIGYPGSGSGIEFGNYLRRHRIDSSLFFAAYGERTVAEVTRSLALRRQLITFALRAQGLAPDRLERAFIEEFTN